MRILLLVVLLTASFMANSSDSITEFKADDEGKLNGWFVSDDRAVKVDTEVRYQGQTAVKLDNDLLQTDTNYVLRSFPLNFQAETIELRAKIRTKDTGAYAGANIFLRQDISNNAIEFSNSQPFVSARDNNWHAVRVTQVVNPNAESIVIGVFLAGPGAAWASDIELWVGGKQFTELPNDAPTSNESTARSLSDLEELPVNWQELDSDTINSLNQWIKVWGFLKYYHPEVAGGKFDWDLVFIESARSIAMGDELNKVVIALLDEIGIPERSDVPSPHDTSDVIFQFTPDWYLHNAIYDNQVATALDIIRSNRHTFGESIYAFSDQLALPEFAREKQHSSKHFPHEIRLLMLARLWNVLEYWFPYRDEIHLNWYGVLNQLTAKTVYSQSDFEFKQTLQELLAQINDGHAGLSEAIFREGSCYLPFTVRQIDSDIVISRIHKELAGINVQPGDRIIAIDEEDIHDLITAQRPYHSASNESHAVYSIANGLMARSCEEPTLLTLNRAGEPHKVAISDYEVPERAHSLQGDVVQTLDGDVTYLKVAGVDFDTVDRALELSRQSRKLVIDVRGYPSEFILYYLGNRLTNEPKLFAHLARVDPAYPGRITMLEHKPSIMPEDPIELDGIAILVDEAAISQSEFSVMAWRELPNTTVIGSTTAGAIGNIRFVPLMDGLSAYFTGLRVYDKNGDDVQYVGNVPDIYIKPTIEDLRHGRDVVVEKAIEILNTL